MHRRIGACVVDLAADNRLDLVGIEEFETVIGRYGHDLAEGLAGDHPLESGYDIVLSDVGEQFDDVSVAFPVDEDKETASAFC